MRGSRVGPPSADWLGEKRFLVLRTRAWPLLTHTRPLRTATHWHRVRTLALSHCTRPLRTHTQPLRTHTQPLRTPTHWDQVRAQAVSLRTRTLRIHTQSLRTR